jgi:NADH dehydrogenase FAD-containing subunit
METISPTLTAARSTKTSAIGMEWEAGSNHERTDDLGSHQPAVVIIGAGFAGLEAARALAHAQVRVTVVDKKNHHCFQPLLYQVATAALSPADVAWPIRSILAGQRTANVVMADVSSVDTVARTVSTSDGLRLAFDYLIIATASAARTSVIPMGRVRARSQDN